jgi:hypothetical protein
MSGMGDQESFHYLLEATDTVSSPKGWIAQGGVVVQIPIADAQKWVLTNQIGIECEQAIDNQTSLRILIEKDLACRDGTEEQNVDTFPNPVAVNAERKLVGGMQSVQSKISASGPSLLAVGLCLSGSNGKGSASESRQ